MELYNLGCGLHAPAGWHNLDRSPNLLLDRIRPIKTLLLKAGILTQAHAPSWPRNIRLHDVRKGVPCPSETADGIYSSHTLEHLYFDEARTVIRLCYIALRPRGVLRVALPDGQAIAAYGIRGDPESAIYYNEQLNAHPLAAPSPAQRVRAVFASPPHRWQPTPDLVLKLFREWFPEPQRLPFRQGTLPRLNQIEHRTDSFFVEAVKPGP